jgi:hypothetical protein
LQFEIQSFKEEHCVLFDCFACNNWIATQTSFARNDARVIVANKAILLYSIFFFIFAKPKVFATFFLKQVRKKAKNLPRWLYRPNYLYK